MVVKNKKVILTIDGGNCNVTPSSRRTIATLSGANGTITFIVDTSLSAIGDELILIISSEEAEFLFLAENGFIFTSCREVDTEAFNGGSSWIGHFFFDGDKFLNTYENC